MTERAPHAISTYPSNRHARVRRIRNCKTQHNARATALSCLNTVRKTRSYNQAQIRSRALSFACGASSQWELHSTVSGCLTVIVLDRGSLHICCEESGGTGILDGHIADHRISYCEVAVPLRCVSFIVRVDVAEHDRPSAAILESAAAPGYSLRAAMGAASVWCTHPRQNKTHPSA